MKSKIGKRKDRERSDAYSGYEDFKKRTNLFSSICCLCWEVLVANDLREEAYECVSEHIEETPPFEWLNWELPSREEEEWGKRLSARKCFQRSSNSITPTAKQLFTTFSEASMGPNIPTL